MNKLTYIISDIDKALAFEWVATYLDKEKYRLSFVLLNSGDSYLENFLKEKQIPVKRITLHKGFKRVFSFFKLLLYLFQNKPDIIHTHLRYATLFGITTGWMCGIKRRIYTRHSSNYNALYHPHAIKYDKLVNKLCTAVVSISEVVSSVLINEEEVDPKKVYKIHHGFDLDLFINPESNLNDELQKKYNPSNRQPVIGVISRYMELKGINYTIDAFSMLLNDYPNALLILANAKGPDSGLIKTKLKQFPQDTYIEIPFENEIAALYQLFDIFVHVPIDPQIEAFGQTYVEALAAGVPSIFTISGVAGEFIIDKQNALVVDYKDSQGIYNCIKKLLQDTELQKAIKNNGLDSISQFTLGNHIQKLEELYVL